MPKGITYLQEEGDNFLDELEEILPASATGWERVAEIHLSRYPDQHCSVDSLKRKFKELHIIKKIPTGDPLCLPAVCRAKHLRYLIIDKMDASDLNEYNSEVEEDDAGEGEDDSGDERASFLVRGGSVGSAEDDEALGLGLDIEDSGNEEGRRNGRSEGGSERGRLSRALVTAASEGGDVRGFSRPSSRASVTATSEVLKELDPVVFGRAALPGDGVIAKLPLTSFTVSYSSFYKQNMGK